VGVSRAPATRSAGGTSSIGGRGAGIVTSCPFACAIGLLSSIKVMLVFSL
jgi:hypothetical protein